VNREQILSALSFKRPCACCNGIGGSPVCPDCRGSGQDPLLTAVQAVGWMLMRMSGLDQTWAGDDGALDAEQAAKSLQTASAVADPEVVVRVDSHRLVVWSPKRIPLPAAFAGFPVTVVNQKPEAGRPVEPLESRAQSICSLCPREAIVCCHCPDCAVAPQTDRYSACADHLAEARRAHDKFRDHMVIWGPVGGPRRAP
jgi:hypothetical protein